MAPIRSSADFQKVASQSPDKAQAWLKEVVKDAGPVLPPALSANLTQLGAMDQASFRAAATSPAVVDLFGQVAKAALVTGSPMPAELPVLHGTMRVDRGATVRVGEQGYREWPDLKLTLELEGGKTLSLQSDLEGHSDIFQFIPGSDVMAFADQPVSLRGYLNGAGDTLRVTEFAPGTESDFVTGRVVVSGDAVTVRARGRAAVEVTDPTLKAELKAHAKLGVILPGEVKDGKYAGNPDGYWMLVKFTAPLTPGPGGDTMQGSIEAGTSTTFTTVTVPAAEAAKVEVGDRMYVKGRFGAGGVQATAATSSAGSPWLTASSDRGTALKSIFEFTEVG